MKNYLLLLFTCLIATVSFAQPFPIPCGAPPPPGASTCDQTCVYCDLDGLTGVNQGGTTTGETYCNQLDVDNASWMAFVAGSSEIGFQITTSFCVHGDGLQVAIFDACGHDALTCNPGMAGGEGEPLTVSYANFAVGNTYFLLVDGYLSDTCGFEIHVVSGSTGFPQLGTPGVPQGPATMSCSTPDTYSIAPVSGAGYYHWTAPEGASINGLSNDEIISGNGGNTVSVLSGYDNGQICVSVGNTCAGEGPKTCLDVVPHPPFIKASSPLTVPFNSLPYLWPVDGVTLLTAPGSYNLMNTLASYQGCDSIVTQLVFVLSPPQGHITGIVYWDANNNGIRDAGELPYTAGAVVQSTSGVFTNSAADGSFAFDNQHPGDTIRAIAPLVGITVTPAFIVVQNGVVNGYNFGFFQAPNNYDLRVTLNANVFRQGFTTWMTVICENIGADPATDATVSVSLPPALQYLIATLTPAVINGNVYTWSLGDMAPGQKTTIQIQLKTPLGTSIGTPLGFEATIEPLADDANPTNNFYSLHTGVVGSFDPNDKTVVPAYVTPALLSNGLPFEYTIRFQNTGNYPAEVVRVIDSLGSTVDPASFQLLAASHPCTWKIRGAGIVEFIFDNIQLPDSTSNEAGSHGFVKFTVKPKRNLALGTVIRNFCDIYFDFNTPVRTNTVGTRVVYFIPGQGLAAQDALSVRPNPAALSTLVDWKTPAPAAGRLRLFDVNGLPRLEIPVTTGQNSVHANVGTLQPGLYFIVLEAGDLLLSNRIVVVQATPVGWN